MSGAKSEAPYKVIWERDLLRSSKLPLGAIAVGMALASYANADGSNMFPSQRTLAADLGATDRTIRKWLGQLREAGYLVEISKGNQFTGSTRYELATPDGKITSPRLDEAREESSAGTGTSPSSEGSDRSAYQAITTSSTNTVNSDTGSWTSPSQLDGLPPKTVRAMHRQHERTNREEKYTGDDDPSIATSRTRSSTRPERYRGGWQSYGY